MFLCTSCTNTRLPLFVHDVHKFLPHRNHVPKKKEGEYCGHKKTAETTARPMPVLSQSQRIRLQRMPMEWIPERF